MTTTVHSRMDARTKEALAHYAAQRGISLSRAVDELVKDALTPQDVGISREQVKSAKEATKLIFTC